MFISLSAYGATDLATSLNTLHQAGVRKVQLSVGVRPGAHLHVLDEFPFEYMVHSNFPLGKEQFNYDLVSNPGFLESFKQMFAFCESQGLKQYSFHTGQYRNLPETEAYKRFVENLAKVSNVAKDYGVTTAVETMYPSNSDTRWVLDTENQIRQFLSEDLPVGIVADAAHVFIGITQGVMSPRLMQDLLDSPKLAEIHVSSNDGRRDIHEPVSQLWCQEMLVNRTNRRVPLVYEGRMNHWGVQDVAKHINLVGSMV